MSQYYRQFTNPTFQRADGGVMPNDTGWQTRHMVALRVPFGAEVAIVELLEAWARYADTYSSRYSDDIGADGVLGPAWAQIGASIRVLLNGETGRLDGGTLDGFISSTLQAEGFDPDTL